jgi:beta-lactamase class D
VRFRLVIVCALLAVLASGVVRLALRHPAARAPARVKAVAPPPSAAGPGRLQAVEDRALERFLSQRGLQGVVALLEDEAPSARCSDRALCERAFLPASTFKLANSIIGLETGVIPSAEFVIPWDGVKRSSAWDRDLSLRAALRESAVWYYQELARRVGLTRMREWVGKFDYGNRQVGDAVDRFWLDGPLAIRPLEQLEFLRKLARARLPLSERTRWIVLDISKLGELDGQVFRGKTGWGNYQKPDELGWFVGFVEAHGGYRYVAVLLFKAPPQVDFMHVRREIAEQVLREG